MGTTYIYLLLAFISKVFVIFRSQFHVLLLLESGAVLSHYYLCFCAGGSRTEQAAIKDSGMHL